MKAGTKPSPNEQSPSRQIDAIVRQPGDWRGRKLSRLRALIRDAHPGVVEEVKWKKPSNPLGVPVWSHEGILCIADTLKNAVRLTFPKGAQMKDPQKLSTPAWTAGPSALSTSTKTTRWTKQRCRLSFSKPWNGTQQKHASAKRTW